MSREIAFYHKNLIDSGLLRSSYGTVWAQHNGNMSNIDYPWKLHLYANGYEDWYNLARAVIPFLVRENATFKTVDFNQHWVGNYPILEKNTDQFGKAFTIYPNNQREFEKLALGLNEIIQHTNLSTTPKLDPDYHNIAFEKNLGDSGRIWYRLERDANGEYISAKEAKQINPKNPYNPYNLADPFKDLIPVHNKPTADKKPEAAAFWNKVKKIAKTELMANSADNKTPSVYFIPNDFTKDFSALQTLLSASGVKFDIHYSNMFQQNVLRVSQKELFNLLYSNKEPENKQAPKQQKINMAPGSFLDALYKIGTSEKILSSSDNNSASVYFYPYDAKDMNTLKSLLRAAGMKYDVHFSNLLNKNVLRVLSEDLTEQIPDTAPQKTTAQKLAQSAPKSPQKKQPEQNDINVLARFKEWLSRL